MITILTGDLIVTETAAAAEDAGTDAVSADFSAAAAATGAAAAGVTKAAIATTTKAVGAENLKKTAAEKKD